MTFLTETQDKIKKLKTENKFMKFVSKVQEEREKHTVKARSDKILKLVKNNQVKELYQLLKKRPSLANQVDEVRIRK